MRVSEVHTEKPRPSCWAFRFRTPILAVCDRGELLGLLAGSTATVTLPCCRHLAVVVCSEPSSCGGAALASQDYSRTRAVLLQEIFG
jgi:hypothetical protein